MNLKLLKITNRPTLSNTSQLLKDLQLKLTVKPTPLEMFIYFLFFKDPKKKYFEKTLFTNNLKKTS